MPNGDADRQSFIDGVRSGWTWGNIGKQLASGAVSGLASWGVGKLLELLFSETDKSVEQLLNEFKDQIFNDLPPIIREQVRSVIREETLADNVRMIAADAEAVMQKFGTGVETMSSQEVWDCYLAINRAKSHAKSLDVAGFGTYFVILSVFAAVCETMIYKNPISPAAALDAWKRRWYEYIADALAEARTHHWNIRVDLYVRNGARVEIEQFVGPGERSPGLTWVVMIDGQFVRWLTAEEERERERTRWREVARLNNEINETLIHPAMHIIRELDEFRARLLVGINLWMIRRIRVDN